MRAEHNSLKRNWKQKSNKWYRTKDKSLQMIAGSFSMRKSHKVAALGCRGRIWVKKEESSGDTIPESENIVEKIITDLSVKNLEKITTNDEEEFNKLKKMSDIEKIGLIVVDLLQ